MEIRDDVVQLLDRVAEARGTTRSQLIRQFVLQGLAQLSYLPEDTKKARNPGEILAKHPVPPENGSNRVPDTSV